MLQKSWLTDMGWARILGRDGAFQYAGVELAAAMPLIVRARNSKLILPKSSNISAFEILVSASARTIDPCLKRVANPITNNNLHVQLTPCTA